MLSFILKYFQHFINTRIGIKSVDYDFNQIEDETNSKGQPTTYPRVLIELEPIEFNNRISTTEQMAELEVTLHIFVEIIEGTNSISKKNNVSKLDVIDAIYKQLSMTNSYILPDELKVLNYEIMNLKRVSFNTISSNGNIKEIIVKYNAMFTDNSLEDTDLLSIILENIVVTTEIDYTLID